MTAFPEVTDRRSLLLDSLTGAAGPLFPDFPSHHSYKGRWTNIQFCVHLKKTINSQSLFVGVHSVQSRASMTVTVRCTEGPEPLLYSELLSCPDSPWSPWSPSPAAHPFPSWAPACVFSAPLDTCFDVLIDGIIHYMFDNDESLSAFCHFHKTPRSLALLKNALLFGLISFTDYVSFVTSGFLKQNTIKNLSCNI